MADTTLRPALIGQPTPPRLRIAAVRKIGRGPLVVESMSQADLDAHAAASHVRKPKAVA